MWVLVIVILSTVAGTDKTTVLEKYDTYNECYHEQVRISAAMEEAYPGDHTFTLECHWNPPQV